MTPVEKQSLESLVARTVGTAGLKIRSFQPCSGGCIHRAHLVEFNDGAKYFVKSSPRAAEMFALEAQGLAALSAADVLRVPALVAVGCLDGGHDCLVLEAIESSLPVADFWERFGRGLAQLHRRSVAESYGWNCDNYLGSSHQRNLWNSNWVAFFAEQRLGYQLRMARQRGLGSGEFYRLIEQLIAELDKWLTVPEDPPSLLHGDLWSGNFLVDENGLPVLFDPARSLSRRNITNGAS